MLGGSLRSITSRIFPFVEGDRAAMLFSSRAPNADSISCVIEFQVRSQEICSRKVSTRSSHPDSLQSSFIAASAAATNSATVSAILTKRSCPYGRTTSRIEVDTTGLPAARYSGVLVGLMKRVDSLRAKGNKATSHPAIYAGNS